MDYILFILLGKDDPRACQVILNLNKANIISLQRGMQGTGAGWAGHWVDTGWTLGGHSSGSGAAGAQSTDHSSDGSTSWTI